MNKKLIRIFNKILREEKLEAYHGAPVPPDEDQGLNNPEEIMAGRVIDEYDEDDEGKDLRGAWFTSVPDGYETAFSYGPYLSTAELDFDNPLIVDYKNNHRVNPPKDWVKADPEIKEKFKNSSLDSIVNGLEEHPEVDGVIAKNIRGDQKNAKIANSFGDDQWSKEFDEYIQFDKDDIDIKDTKDNSELYNSIMDSEDDEEEEDY